MWDYSDKVIDHYRNPRNVGKIDNADAIGEAGSLACGDSLKIYLKISNGIVTDAAVVLQSLVQAFWQKWL